MRNNYEFTIFLHSARIMFAVTVFTSALNGYFVISGCVTSSQGGYGTDLMNNAALVMGMCFVCSSESVTLSIVQSVHHQQASVR